ncbi:MAG TPA: nickel-responsive transcriptional regulator NikR [Planctomycetota bacterium]|nr:nickel-responsive transcriptional regulator NikR [Planctomycetota bacterium]
MSALVRFGVSMEKKLLDEFDGKICSRGYDNRSEAIRDIVRDKLVELAWESGASEVVGTLTIVYDHEVHELTDRLTDIQHKYHTSIVSSMHAHLTPHTCLEVIILRGRPSAIRTIADALLAAKGVRHGKLVTTTTGKEF